MMLGAQLVGTTLAQGLLCNSEVAQRIKEADAVFPISGHPVMPPDVGFIELPVGLAFWDSIMPLPEHAAVRVVNHATDEQRKKKKDDKEKKWWSKQ